MATTENPMIGDLLSKLAEETTQAKADKKATAKGEKLDLKVEALGIGSKQLSTFYTVDDFKAYGLTPKESENLQALSAKLRAGFVAKHGEVAGFDSKRGTSIVGTLKQFQTMALQGVFDLSPADNAAIDEGLKDWYDNAPLRGIAGAKRAKAKAEAEASTDATEANAA